MFTVLMDKHCTGQWNCIFSFRPQFTLSCFANFLFNPDRTILHKGWYDVTFVYHNHKVNRFGWDGRWNISIHDRSVKVEEKWKCRTFWYTFKSDLFTSKVLHKTCTYALTLQCLKVVRGYLILNQSAWVAAHHTFFCRGFHQSQANSPMDECITYIKQPFSAAVSLQFSLLLFFYNHIIPIFHVVCWVLIFILFSFMHLAFLSTIFNQSEKKMFINLRLLF